MTNINVYVWPVSTEIRDIFIIFDCRSTIDESNIRKPY